MQRCRPACPYCARLLRVGDQCVDRLGQPALEDRRVARVVVHQQRRSDRRRPPRGCRRHRRPPPPSRTPSPPDSRCPAARTPTGRRKPLLLRVFRGSCRSAASPAPRTRRCGRGPAPAPPSVTSAAISGVSGAPAHNTSCTSGANWCAAATRCATPFCRVIRPTNATIGRLGSTPSSASTDSPGSGSAGYQTSVSIPLRTTCTRFGIQRRVGAQHVVAHAGADRDHRVGGLDRGRLHPRRHPVAAAELLGLPRPHRLERMRGQHVRDAVQQRGQVPGQPGVPGVRVHDGGLRRRRWPSPGRPTASTAPGWRP